MPHGRFHPYAPLLREGFWYVMGHDVVTTKCARIAPIAEARSSRATATGSSALPTDPHGLPADPGRDATVAIVRIDQAGDVRTVSSARFGRPSPAGRRRRGKRSNLDAFRSWLFGWGVHAEVVGPADVRDGLIEWLRTMASRS